MADQSGESPEKVTRKLTLYRRNPDGSRTALVFTVDDKWEILSILEQPSGRPAGARVVANQPASNPSPHERQLAHLDARGIAYRVVDNTILMMGTPPQEQALLSFFSEEPCHFPGCDKLREEYKADFAKLVEDENCSNCQKGELIRRYMDIIRPLLNTSAHGASVTDTRDRAAS